MRNNLFILLFSLSSLAFGQTFTKLSIKTGLTISGQTKTPKHFADGGPKLGIAVTVEPTILTFGSKKQFDFNTDLSFIQKGGYNYSPIVTYDPYGQVSGTGSETYKVTLNYFSISPTVKFNFLKLLFIKAGPRLDIFTNFKTNSRFASDPRTSKDFNAVTYGLTYGVGICTGKDKMKFLCEFIGQNDFSNSSYNKASGQAFRNYCYLLNLGLTFRLKAKEE